MKVTKAIELVKDAFDAWEWEFGTGNDWSKEHEARDMAVKALEIVHCGECRFVESNNCPMYRAHFGYTDNDFCSIGKPKEQEHE